MDPVFADLVALDWDDCLPHGTGPGMIEHALPVERTPPPPIVFPRVIIKAFVVFFRRLSARLYAQMDKCG